MIWPLSLLTNRLQRELDEARATAEHQCSKRRLAERLLAESQAREAALKSDLAAAQRNDARDPVTGRFRRTTVRVDT